MKRARPHVVVGVGGYASLPCLVAARLRRVPAVVHEQNAAPGPRQPVRGPAGRPRRRSRCRARRCAAPSSRATRSGPRSRRSSATPVRPPLVAIFGGSLGAGRLNDAALELYDRWRQRDDVAVRHVTGAARLRPAARARSTRPRRADDRLPYELVRVRGPHGDAVRPRATLAVCRAGAVTVAELAAAGVPAVLVPLPGAPGDHQTRNARTMVDAGAAVARARRRVRRRPARRRSLTRAARPTRTGLDTMATAAATLARPDAAARLADLVEEVARWTTFEPTRARSLVSPRRVHIVGIGGAGMSAIATVLARMGHRVSGSDLKESRAARPPAAARASTPASATAPSQRAGRRRRGGRVDRDPALEPRGARRRSERGVPVLRRAEALRGDRRDAADGGGRRQPRQDDDVVDARADPAGRRLAAELHHRRRPQRGRDQRRLDDGEWLVVEADESDGTFLELAPEAAIVTNVEPDHLDHYGGFAALDRRVRRSSSPASPGARVVCADDAVARRLAAPTRRRVTYGWADDADYRIVDYEGGRDGSRFDARAVRGERSASIELPVPGRHNALNAVGAAALALELGVAVRGRRRRAAGLRRRRPAVPVPRRARRRHARRRLRAHPRRDRRHDPRRAGRRLAASASPSSSRTGTRRTARLWRDFADAFAGADAVVLTDVYAGRGDAPAGRVGASDPAGGARPPSRRCRSTYLPRRADLVEHVPRLARPGDVVLTLGAGDLTTLPDEWLRTAWSAVVSLDALAERAREPVARRVAPRTCRSRSSATYRVGGPVAVLVRVGSAAELRRRRRWRSRATGRRRPRGRPGLEPARGRRRLPRVGVVLEGEFESVELPPPGGDGDEVVVRAGGAVPLPVLARRAADAGIAGLEFFVGIPGSVGGAVRMNAGGHGRETADVLRTRRDRRPARIVRYAGRAGRRRARPRLPPLQRRRVAGRRRRRSSR